MAGAVAVVGGVSERAAEAGEPAALDRLAGPRALHRGRVDQQQIVAVARALARELCDQRLDLTREPAPAFVERITRGQVREQMPQASGGDRQEPRIRRDPHDRLRHAQGDDLRVGDLPPGISGATGEEFVRDPVNNCEQQVEVGVHRGPLLGRRWLLSTADFDLRCYVSCNATPTPRAVALLI